jgi:outer membrane receptor protein involved in Fe transport
MMSETVNSLREAGRTRWSRSLLAAAICGASLQAPSAFAEDNGIEEVVVTGSRIAVDSATASSSPVAVISGDEIRTAGQADLTELLRESPALNQSLPANFSAFTDAGLTESDLGLGLLDLRGLGVVRTLTLVNGRRHVPGTQGSAAVDINTIPSNMVKRVETLTGGASSVYGADAVTGVVNFILRDGGDFDGIEFNLQSGVSDRADSEEYQASVAGGFEFSEGRGDVVFGVEYYKGSEVIEGTRDYAVGEGDILVNTPEIAAAAGVNPDAANAFVEPFGLGISSPLGVFDLTTFDSFFSLSSFFNSNPAGTPVPNFPGTDIPILQVVDSPDNGVPRAYQPGLAPDPFTSFGIGDGLGTTKGSLFPEQDRLVFNLNGSFDLNENVSLFAETKYAYTETFERDGSANFNDAIPIAYDNPFIPTALAGQIAQLQGLGLIPPDPMDGSFYGFGASRDSYDDAVLPRTTAERETMRIVLGAEGTIPVLDGIDFEVSYNYGRTDIETNNEKTRIEDRFYAALDSTVDPATGEIVCRSDLDPTALPWVGAAFPVPEFSDNAFFQDFVTPTRFTQFVSFEPGDGSCVPFNPFGSNSATQAYADWVYVNAEDETELTQQVLFGSLSGTSSALFELPAGPIAWAAGLEYREEESEFSVSALERGLNTWEGSNGVAREGLEGDYDVFEYFFEVQAPLLQGLPFAELLEVNGAMRFSDYSTVGSNDAWSVGGRWSPGLGLTVRSTYSEAVRAPNIGELFSPRQPAFFGVPDDPCSVQNIDAGSEFRPANCAEFVDPGFNAADFVSAAIPGVSGGNPNLAEETAETFTAGVIFEPDFVPGLQVIVDYYEIEIEGAIAALAPERIAQACVDLPSTSNQYCPLITRDPNTGFITFHESGQVNLGAIETSGVDFAANYTFALGRNYGELALRVTGSHLLDWEEFQDPINPGISEDRVNEFGYADWIVNFRADWRIAKWTVSWAGRYETEQLLPTITNEQLDANPLFVDPSETDDAFVHDFNFAYDLSDQVKVYGGVNNAFDEEPFLGALSRPAGPRGRFFFAGMNWRM